MSMLSAPDPETDTPLIGWVLHLLRRAPYGCEMAVLADLCAFSSAALATVLEKLKDLGALEEPRKHFYVATGRNMGPVIPEEMPCRMVTGSFLSVLVLFERRKFGLFLEKALNAFNVSIEERRYLTARRIYDIVSELCIRWKPPLTEQELCRAYIAASYEMLTISQSFPWKLRHAMVWHLKTRGVAYALRDTRACALIDLSIGYLKVNNFSEKNNYSYINSIKRGINLAQLLNDEDVINKSLPFNCFLYYLQGNFLKSVNCAYSQFYTDKINSYKYYNRIIYIFSALSSVQLGEYDVSLNILQLGHQTAIGLKRQLDADLMLAISAYVHMLKNNGDKAIEIINELLEKSTYAILTYGELWAVRLLAYYHYLQGHIHQSYTCYKSWLGRTEAENSIHSGYLAAPFMLELIVAYHIAGYEPLVFSVEEELEQSQKSSSASLHASALRFSSVLRAHHKGWTEPEIQGKLEESLRLGRVLAAPVELAKTLFVAAGMHVALGQSHEAMAALREALDIQRRYVQPPVPPQLSAWLAEQQGAGPSPETTQADCALPVGGDGAFIFQAENMRQLRSKVEMLAPKNTSVLILGESGVGKELVARHLYEMSGQTGHFVAVNMASIPEELFESEFYGHEKGSFTGAVARKEGLLELAHKGTLFLDEVGDLSPRLQVKLLRVLQEKTFMRVGGTKELSAEFRIVAATNKDLEKEVKNGYFREDLYYRINVVSLLIPPLRQRGHDVIFLAQYFLDFFLKLHQCPPRRFSGDDIDFLMSYGWPGNVRELRNYIERYVLLSDQEIPLEQRKLLRLEAAPSAQAAPSTTLDKGKGENIMRRVSPLPVQGEENNIFSRMEAACGDVPLLSLEDIKNQYFEYVYVRAHGLVNGPEGLANLLKISKVTAYTWIDKLQLKDKFLRIVIKKER